MYYYYIMSTKKVTKKVAKKALEWSKEHQSRYNALFSRFVKTHPDANIDTYMIDYAKPRNGLYDWLVDAGYAKGTLKNHYLTVGRYLEINGNAHYKPYLVEGTRLRHEIDNEEADGKQTEKEKIHNRPQSYFHTIINNLKEDYQLMPYKEHMRFLLLCLSVLQPPVRTDYYTSARIIHAEKENKGELNYIMINRKTKKATYIINDDKVSNSRFYTIHKEYSHIPVEDDFLNELIMYSITTFKRKFLFQKAWQEDTGPISQATYLQWLRKITQSEGINQDMMRSSYITDFYRTHARLSDQEKLSFKMRHSANTANRYYNKVEEEEPMTKSELQEENEQLKNDLELCESSNQCCAEKKISEKKYNKRRYDVLYNLNHKGATPRQSTLERYDIFYDEETKLYV